MNIWKITGITLGIGFLAAIIITIISCVSLYNEEAEIRTSFNQKIKERTAFYDGMIKIISGKSQVAIKVDTSFTKNIKAVMEGRKDAEGIMMKWITETNPNANFNEVAALYKDLSRSIEAERKGFFETEKMIQDIVKQHELLMTRFPSGFILKMMGKEMLDYKVIQSSKTKQVMDSGIDDNESVF